MQKTLLQWYKKYGRHDLPWRNTENMYHIYLSEIMLQQTQVNRVRDEYYPQFLEKFPSLKILANANQDEVLSAWSGLGYYSRARNLHKTAILHPTSLPTTQEELLQLPGIGRYTASAICSFGHNQNIPVVDTNIARVIKRVFALLNSNDISIWNHATQFVNEKEPRHHNLALMDLGSLICSPKNPKCEECPFQKECLGKEEPELYTQTKKKEYISMELFYGVYIKNNKIALKISQEKMYKDMLVLPSIEPIEENFLGKFKHSYTKYRLSVNLYQVEELDEELTWIDLESFTSAPISSLTKKAQKFFY
ncbi:MAG: A/G-specific adenine glycosylase [Campylobacterota bacterium]|nr:A/G-specific adenine glycosylase [Campylobacterota bacterium]